MKREKSSKLLYIPQKNIDIVKSKMDLYALMGKDFQYIQLSGEVTEHTSYIILKYLLKIPSYKYNRNLLITKVKKGAIKDTEKYTVGLELTAPPSAFQQLAIQACTTRPPKSIFFQTK